MDISNIINLIADDKNNSLHSVIKFSEDRKNLINFQGKQQVLIGNGKNNLESLAREILVQTHLKNKIHLLSTEDVQENRGRADIIASIDGTPFNIIECKQISDIQTYNRSKFQRLVADGMNQLILYTKDLKEDTFISLYLMDLEKIVNNPINLDLFNKADKSEKQDSFECFKKFGVYVQTRVWCRNTDALLDEVHHEFPNMCMFNFREDDFGGVKTTIPLSRAIMLPTSSPKSFGIKNVRNIKDPNINAEKRTLIYDILNTSKKGFKLGDPNLVSSAGSIKCFLLSREDSLVRKNEKHLYVSTLNGAIVDGQNSIHAYEVILSVLQFLIDKKYPSLTGFNRILADSVLSDFKTQDEQERFYRYLETCEIPIDISPSNNAENARNVAISKNNTMKVTGNELKSSSCQEELQILSNDLLTRGKRLSFPKNDSLFSDDPTNKNILSAEYLMKALSLRGLKPEDYQEQNKRITYLGLVSGKTKPKYYDALNKVVHKDDAAKNSPERAKVELEIKSINVAILENQKDINQLEPMAHLDASVVEMIEEKKAKNDEMAEKKDLLENQKTKLKEPTFKLKNVQETIDPLFDAIVLIRERTLFNMKSLSETRKDEYDIVRSFFRNIDSASDHILGMFLLHEMETSNRKSKSWMNKLSNNDIDKMFSLMVEGFVTVKNNFKQVSVVMIKNKAKDDITFPDNSGKSFTLGDIRRMYINV